MYRSIVTAGMVLAQEGGGKTKKMDKTYKARTCSQNRCKKYRDLIHKYFRIKAISRTWKPQTGSGAQELDSRTQIPKNLQNTGTITKVARIAGTLQIIEEKCCSLTSKIAFQ